MSRPRRWQSEQRRPTPLVGLCQDCGKVRYASRRDALQEGARAHQGKRMRAYRCGDFWHLTSVTAKSAAIWRARPPSPTPGDCAPEAREMTISPLPSPPRRTR